jgi:L-malate glycosyltransferase
VTFIGSVSFDLVPYYMSSCDTFILSSLDEGFGRVLIEAMAMKKLVISTKVGGTKDIIEDGETGFFMEKANADSFVKIIENVLNLHEIQRSKIIEKAYKNVISKYEFNSSMKEFIQLYDSVILK